MKQIRNCRGSISIFLILVLMPMYTCAYLAIDSAKYMAAKTKLTGTVDLMGNAALSSFDETLKEMYGIFAMAGSSEELYATMIEYGTSMIENDTENIVSTSEKGITASYCDDMSLYNPEVLEAQIKSLMKYRAPYNWAYGMAKKVSSLLNLDKVSQILKKCTDYATQTSNLNESVEKAYILLKDGQIDDAKELIELIKNGLSKSSVAYSEMKKSIDALEDKELKDMLQSGIAKDSEIITEEKVEELRSALQSEEENPGEYRNTEIFQYLETAYARKDATGGAQKTEAEAIKLKDLKEIGNTDLSAIVERDLDVVVRDLLPKTEKSATVEREWSEKSKEEAEGDSSLKGLSLLTGLNLKNVTTGVMEASYVTEYLTEMFSCATTGENDKNAMGKPYFVGPIFGGEAEYVVFGYENASSNVFAAMELIFAVRLATNSLYAFSNAEMRRSALSAATAISGWCGIGVPVMQNLILLAWSAAESVMDIATLSKGDAIPIYKTSKTWTLGLGNISNVLKNGVKNYGSAKIDDIYISLRDASNEAVDEVGEYALQYIENATSSAAISFAETVTQKAFDAITKALYEMPDIYTEEQIKKVIVSELNKDTTTSSGYAIAKDAFIKYCLPSIATQIANATQKLGQSDEAVARTVANEAGNIVVSASESLLSYVEAGLEKYKSIAKEQIDSKLSSGADAVKAEAMTIIENYADELGSLLGDSVAETSSGKLSLGTTIGITYKEYLKLFALFNLSRQKGKANMLRRCLNVIQINCATKTKGFDLSKLHTALEIKMDAKIGLHTLKREAVFTY